MSKIKALLSCAVALSAFYAPHALATVTVTVNGSGCSGCVTFTPSVGYFVTVSGQAAPAVVVTTTNSERIVLIEIANTSTTSAATLEVFAETSEVQSVSAFVDVGLGELWVTEVHADTLGAIYANLIGDVIVDGDITGTITQVASGLSPSADGIGMLLSDSGSITGDITAAQRIVEIAAPGGDLGASGNHIDISSGTSIGSIRGNSIYAAISITGSAADLDSLVAETGVFAGSLSCRKITGSGIGDDYGLDIKGDLEADIYQTAAMDTNFRIWGSLASTSEIDIHIANGATYQVILNYDNNSNTWAGVFKVNGTALSSPPYYTTPASSIGGGSVGLAPFNLHGVSCVPVDSTTTPEPTVYPDSCPSSTLLCDPEAPNNVANARKWATMRMYGPVVFNLSSGQKPCTIERRVIGGSTWTDVTSDYRFDIYTSSDGDGTPDAGERVVRIRRENTSCLKYFPVGYDYRVKPVTGRMKCKGVDGGDTVNVYAFEYNFTLPYDCEESLLGRFDENGDDDLTSLDMAYLAVTQRDLNEDSAFNALDFDLMGRALAEFPN